MSFDLMIVKFEKGKLQNYQLLGTISCRFSSNNLTLGNAKKQDIFDIKLNFILNS